MRLITVGLILLLLAAAANGQRGTFMTAQEFQHVAFPSSQPEAQTLWLNGEQQQQAAAILNHAFNALRVRYWRDGTRTAWVLEEIGKEQPITIGVIVENGRIADLVVLAFRESRGGEIRYPFFTRQFQGLSLLTGESTRADPALTGTVDGITGATLSVRAAKKIATLALFFHQQVMAVGAGDIDQ